MSTRGIPEGAATTTIGAVKTIRSLVIMGTAVGVEVVAVAEDGSGTDRMMMVDAGTATMMRRMIAGVEQKLNAFSDGLR